MSVRVMSEVWGKYPGSGSKKLVLLAIADNANDDGEAWPAVGLIALKCGVSERHVQAIVAELVAEKWLKVQRPTNERITNTYRVTPPRDAEDFIAARRKEFKEFAEKTRVVEVMEGVNPASPGEPRFTPLPHSAVKENEILTEGQRMFLDAFGAKRFKTKVQKDTVKNLEARHGIEKLRNAAEWAAKKGLTLGSAVVAVESALDRPKKPAASERKKSQNPGLPGRTVIQSRAYREDIA